MEASDHQTPPHLPPEVRGQILSRCEVSSLKQIRLVNSLWSAEGARWLFATIIVYLWPSSFANLRFISESRLSTYVRNILYIAERVPLLSFEDWNDSIQGIGGINRRVIPSSAVRSGFDYYNAIHMKQMQLWFQKADWKTLDAALPHFVNLKRVEIGNGRIIQNPSKLFSFSDFHASLQPFCKMLGKHMECDPAFFNDIHWLMATQSADDWHIPDTSATVDRRAHMEEIVLHDVQAHARLFQQLWSEMADSHSLFNNVSPITTLRIRVGGSNYHHVLADPNMSAGEATRNMHSIALFTQNLVSLELTFTNTAVYPPQETEPGTLDDMAYLRQARWPRLRKLSLHGICPKEDSLLEFLSGHNQTLIDLIMTEVRFLPGVGSWRSFLHRKSEWKGTQLQSARFTRLYDSEFADGLTSYPATAPIETYILQGGEFPELALLVPEF